MDKTFVYDTLVRQAKINKELEQFPFRQTLSTRGYWEQIGGNIVVAPRQCGKTSSLIAYASLYLASTGKVLAITPFSTMTQPYKDAGFETVSTSRGLEDFYFKTRGRPSNQTHLIVDEFMLVKREHLHHLLGEQWKSVSMVGSFLNE